MAVNTVTASMAASSAIPGGGTVTVLQSVAGATGDSTFIISLAAMKRENQLSMRGRTLMIVNNGTAFGAISSVNASIDATNYETLKTIQPATIGANTIEAAVAVPAVTSGTITYAVIGHDANFLKIVTTGGDATSGFTVSVGA